MTTTRDGRRGHYRNLDPLHHGPRPVAPCLEQHAPGLAAPRGYAGDLASPASEDPPVSKPGLNLDVEAPDEVAGVLRAAADAYQQRAEEQMQAQTKDRTPVIWAAAAGRLDDAADAIERIVSRHSSIFHKK